MEWKWYLMKGLFGGEKTDTPDLFIEWVKETCVLCGQETAYDFKTPITQREFYVEGAGQLCRRCFRELYSEKKN